MGRERDGLAERERQDEEKVANIRARQERAATSFDAAPVVEAATQEAEAEEEAPKPKAKSSSKKTSK